MSLQLVVEGMQKQIEGLQIQLDLKSMRTEAEQRILDNHGRLLNRRVDVENVLISVAQGKRGPLSPEECRELANKLGMID